MAFPYTDESFADIQLLRYEVKGFDALSLQQKTLIYHLTEAALCGRDILYAQNGRLNLRLRHLLEAVYRHIAATEPATDTAPPTDLAAFRVYMKRFWFSHGPHHHYGGGKFAPGFSEAWFRRQLDAIGLTKAATPDLLALIFDPAVDAMRCNQRDGDDLLLTSASDYYEAGITQGEAEAYYAAQRAACRAADPDYDAHPVQHGLNSRLCRQADGTLCEHIASTADGALFAPALRAIVAHLEAARPHCENDTQREALDRLIDYYHTGDLRTYDDYCIAWLRDTESLIDFVNGFTETYGDPLGLKASWESIVNYKDLDATRRTETLAREAQWFEDHSPVDPRFKKPACRGISAKVITGAIIAGDLYPATAIGINLPNSDWVRRDHGSKSVTIGNFTEAYRHAAQGSGMLEEFCIDAATAAEIRRTADIVDDLHTDLHECLGHGSGQLLPGVASDVLGVYGSTIEEARADLFALYYLADPKMTALGLTPDDDAYRGNYYTYLQNGLMTQLIRIAPGDVIEEAHMRNRALIARWVTTPQPALGTDAPGATLPAELIRRDGKTYLRVNDYPALRRAFGILLAEIQRIKSTGDYDAARRLVEDYGVQIPADLHREVLDRYARLGQRPYKGFINPVYTAHRDAEGRITDVTLDYTEPFDTQALRYSRDYTFL